ncbi:MAG TPA: PDZ domain-containing protein, partial [Kiritimatiellia bacterium]|nr:PDZ domain-containing protein [Kiritimatiellia bacterium]
VGLLSWSGYPVAADSVRFGWNDAGVAVTVDDQPANRVLEVISAATGIPIVLDPANDTRLNGTYRKRTLEELLLDLSPGMVIQYRFDDRLNTHIIDRVYSSSMADPELKQSQLRELVISRERLEQGIVPPMNRPLRYSGIGAAIQPTSDQTGIFLQPLSPSAPAARAGIKLGDVVVAVDGRAINSFTNVADIAAAIRGPENSDVELTIRYPDGTTRLRPVRREVFTWEPPAP